MCTRTYAHIPMPRMPSFRSHLIYLAGHDGGGGGALPPRSGYPRLQPSNYRFHHLDWLLHWDTGHHTAENDTFVRIYIPFAVLCFTSTWGQGPAVVVRIVLLLLLLCRCYGTLQTVRRRPFRTHALTNTQYTRARLSLTAVDEV